MKQNEIKTEKVNTLTARQHKAIPFVVSCQTYTEAIEKAGIGRKTFYEWLKQPEFKAELDRQRNEITEEAFGILSQSITKAVETLVGLLDTQDSRLKRLVCNDIIEHIFKHKEIAEIEERLKTLEQAVNDRKT